jgi:hypothetical protein
MTERPSRDVIFAMVFDKRTGKVRREIKQDLETITCERSARRGGGTHRLAVALRTTFGWWIAWRRPNDEHDTRWTWEYDWATDVGAYELATCHCGRARNIGPFAARLR